MICTNLTPFVGFF